MRKWAVLILVLWLAMVTALVMPLPSSAPAAAPANINPVRQAHANTEEMAAPTPTPFIFPAGTIIAGQDIGGLSPEEAQQRVDLALRPFLRPLRVVAAGQDFLLQPAEVGMTITAAEVVEQARTTLEAGGATEPQQFPLQVVIDRTALQRFAEELAAQIDRPAQLALDVSSQTFVVSPGLQLEIEGSVERLLGKLQSPDSNRRVTLATRRVYQTEPPDVDQIHAVIEAQIEDWPGVVGIYVTDIAGNRPYTYTSNAAFSGASTMKIAILLQSYISIEKFTTQQRKWLEAMIVESDNFSSNRLLSAIGKAESGRASELQGLRAMNRSIQALGLKATFMLAPYETGSGIIDRSSLGIPATAPSKPFTDADPYLQTTPAEMGQLLLMIAQCEQGSGTLLETFSQLTPRRCAEMLSLLELAGDRDKIRAGIPEKVRVAHKSGWIGDTRADVALVGSGDEALVISIWIYSNKYDDWIPEEVADPLIADIARTLYSAYYPMEASRSAGRGQ